MGAGRSLALLAVLRAGGGFGVEPLLQLLQLQRLLQLLRLQLQAHQLLQVQLRALLLLWTLPAQ